jgi:L-lactate dehydrogenase complex protein LldG
MANKEDILAAIRRNKPAPKPLPDLPETEPDTAGLKSRFCEQALLGGAEWMEGKAIVAWSDFLAERYPEARRVVTTLPDLADDRIQLLDPQVAPQSLSDVDVAILPGRWAVAENGAIWLEDSDMGNRVLPFITQHLILLIDPANIVENMHQVYRRIEVGKAGFGVFIAGPSKTADIEQSLVKGAQGARTALFIFRAESARE